MFIAEKDKGDAVVNALNGQEVDGRTIKVDVAKAKGGGGRSGGKDTGGKSARELQALREEGASGKKRSRRRRPKKD